MRRMVFVFMALAVMVSCSDKDVFDVVQQDIPSAKSKVMTRIDGNCSIGNDNERFDFISTDSGYISSIYAFGQTYKPRNNTMAMIQVWNTGLTKATSYQVPYDSICMNATQDSLIAYVTINSTNKSKFFITDYCCPLKLNRAKNLIRNADKQVLRFSFLKSKPPYPKSVGSSGGGESASTIFNQSFSGCSKKV